MHTKGENIEKTSKGSGFPTRRYHDLYYGHAYLEKDLFNIAFTLVIQNVIKE
jgi:hypothetical protein